MRKIKNIIKLFLDKFGLIVLKRSSRVYLPESESYKIVSTLINIHDPVIIDGGSNSGETVNELSRLLPDAEFHCFEPDLILYDELKQRFKNIRSVNVSKEALGDKTGSAIFNINAARPTNSLLDVSDKIEPELKELCQLVKKIQVPITTIDDYCDRIKLERVDVLKLDLQGYDFYALKGAHRMLRNVKIVLVEALFSELYKGCELFPSILNLMIDEGFMLYTISGLHYGKNDQLQWADAIFIKK